MVPKLSILTVVHKNLAGLECLYKILSPVLSSDVEWIIKDSACCPRSLIWANSIVSPYVNFVSQPDSGLYDALNTAIVLSKANFYLTVGSDDIIFPSGIEDFLEKHSQYSQFDIISYPVIKNNKLCRPRRWIPSSINACRYISSHSVGTIIKKSLHMRVGYYDASFRILADSLFIKLCMINGAKLKHVDSPAMGIFGMEGVSSRERHVILKESFNYQTRTGSNVLGQYVLLAIRYCTIFLHKS